MTTQSEMAQKSHNRAVRFFWCLLIGATTVSVIGNVVHAMLPLIPRVAIQVGAAAIPPLALLAAVHGIALAVRAGASGTVYRWAVGAVAVIGVGAFSLSFVTLQDLMKGMGYSPQIAWVFPAIVDTAVAVSTLMLVALGDKPAPRPRHAAPLPSASGQPTERKRRPSVMSAKPPVSAHEVPTPQKRNAVRGVQRGAGVSDTERAQDLIASRVTTQPVETVVAVLGAHREGLSINAAAKAAGVNYRTAQRIVEAETVRDEATLARIS